MSLLRTTARPSRRPLRVRRRRQAALSLPETMLSISLCMPLILGAIHLFCTSMAEQALSHQSLRIEQEAQFALNIITTVVQLAGHQDPLIAAPYSFAPRLQGLDDATLLARSDIDAGKSGPGIHGSDVLIVRFTGNRASGNVLLNCAGIPVPPAASDASDKAKEAQGISVFYVASGPGGENELRCKYRTASGWDSEPLIQGVESFQLLFGVDRDGDGLPEQFLRAGAIAEAIHTGASALVLWNQIVAVKVALLMRSTQHVLQRSKPATWDLFGDAYSAHHAATDPGTQLSSADFNGELRHRLRRSYEHVIFIRNPSLSAVSE